MEELKVILIETLKGIQSLRLIISSLNMTVDMLEKRIEILEGKK